jgi:hypothetical protein
MTNYQKIDKLVFGGNLPSLEYAFREGIYIFYEKLETPFHLEYTKEGLNKKDVIENYAFLLSMAGLNLSSNFVSDYRINDNILTITGKIPWKFEYSFNEIIDFSRQEKERIYKVVDYVNVRSCGNHDVRELKMEDNFVKEIYFYPSKRMNSSKNFSLSTHNYETITKDAIVVSYLTKSQIEDEEYSQIYSRLRLKEIMKEVGIQGKRCGTRPNGKIKRNAIKLEFSKREINEVEEVQRNFYYTESKNPYLNRLYRYLYGRNSKTKKT